MVLSNPMQMIRPEVAIYTDGSCHTELRIGGWVAIVFTGSEQIVLKEIVPDTTHNRMELMAVIKGIEYIDRLGIKYEQINVYSDSQYVVNLVDRGKKLRERQFRSKSGTLFPNADLVEKLLDRIEKGNIRFIKIKAHQKTDDSDNYNREADKLVRKMVREAVDKCKD